MMVPQPMPVSNDRFERCVAANSRRQSRALASALQLASPTFADEDGQAALRHAGRRTRAVICHHQQRGARLVHERRVVAPRGRVTPAQVPSCGGVGHAEKIEVTSPQTRMKNSFIESIDTRTDGVLDGEELV